eukprot:1192329-Prorocentrum_minimum.AAC.1
MSTWDVKPADSPNLHGDETLVQSSNDICGLGIAGHANVLGLAANCVLEDEKLIVLPVLHHRHEISHHLHTCKSRKH